MRFSSVFAEILEIRMEQQTDGYVARTASNELNSSAVCREWSGEADSGILFSLKYGFRQYLQEILVFRTKRKTAGYMARTAPNKMISN